MLVYQSSLLALLVNLFILMGMSEGAGKNKGWKAEAIDQAGVGLARK